MIAIEERDGVRILALDRPPVNAIELELVRSLGEALTEAADEERPLVLTSSQAGVFSAGFDLEALDRLSHHDLASFVHAFQKVCRRVLAHPGPLVAALPGHAIAGGLLVVAAADRIFLAEGKGKLGLPEVALGVPLPGGSVDLLRSRLQERVLATVLLDGRNRGAEEALAAGMVDEIVPVAALLDRAVADARRLAEAPAYTAMKTELRRRHVDAFDRDVARAGDDFVEAWLSPVAKQARGRLLASLAAKKG